ncbi:MAG: cobyric acid synthase [Bauldia sp.]
MIQGTGSHVGKSTLVAGLCRALVRRGIRVAPFKPQNMSNNAAVAADGGEIGRAQALQARAAKLTPSVHMNPVLLKPESDTGAQVIVQGKRAGAMRAAEYGRRKSELMPRVLESFARVGEGMDLVLIEGAGSPAEVNLRAGDIANMGFAEAADVPVVLVGDIDRGGVIAGLVGTQAVLAPRDRARVKGFVVNKMRGDAALFTDGARFVAERTGWPCLGVVPWFDAADALPAEDTLSLRSSPRKRGPISGAEPGVGMGPRFRENQRGGGKAIVVVPHLPRIANFDDLDPLRAEPDVSVVLVEPGEVFPEADVILVPGSKSTIADLAFLRAQGWDIDIIAHHRRGGRVVGLCGGYQMLGRSIADPDGVEGSATTAAGLGLLDVATVLGSDKATRAVSGRDIATGEPIAGYEIHLGVTFGPDCARPVVDLGGRVDGARSLDGRVVGTYVHGLFAADGFRRAFLDLPPSDVAYEAMVEATLDALADHLERHIDIAALLAIAGYRAKTNSEPSATTANSAALATT